MIELQGLTAEDAAICELLWRCETEFEVNNLIQMMPAAMADRALVMRELMLWSIWDEEQHVSEQVQDIIRHCSR